MAIEAVRVTRDVVGQTRVETLDVEAAASAITGATVGCALGAEPGAVLRAFSLAAAAPPGAVLVTAGVAAFLDDTLPLGAVRLATLGPPEPVFARAGDGFTAVAAPAGLDAIDHDLPLRHASFVGRVDEVAAVAAAVASGAVVTVTGPGGVGKTETALRAAAIAALRDGAAIRTVELAPTPPDEVATELDRALAALRQRPGLLLVDNAEHVVDEVRTWLGETARDDVAVLVTSRAPLRVTGEVVFVLPLLAAHDAAALFADRATRAGAAAADDDAVAMLCERLDFLPLAIELAAARSRVLSPRAITERLDDRFALLATTADAAHTHHRSLQAAIAWSDDLLDATDRAAFHRLGVFADRFDLTQAMHVGVDLDTLARLVDQSLVAAEPEADFPYRLLDSVRAFAHDALERSGDAPRARDKLVEWLVAFTVPLDGGNNEARDAVFRHLDQIPADVRAAVEHAAAHRPADAVVVVGRLGAWFWDRGRVAEGVALAEAAVAADPGGDALGTARLHNALANLYVRAGEPSRAVPHYERALDLRVAHGAAVAQVASTHNDFGTCLLQAGELDAARVQLGLALTGYSEVADRWGIATATTNLAALAVTRGELDGAATSFARAAAEFAHMGDHAQAAAARTNEGLVLLELGDPRADAALAAAARDVLRAGVRSILPHVLAGAATCALAAGDPARAASLWGAARAIGHLDDNAQLESQIGDAVGWARLDELTARGAHASDDELLAWVEATPLQSPRAAGNAELRRGPSGWEVTFHGDTARLPAIKGVEYLARLLAAPGTELHVAELAGVSVHQRGTEVADAAALAAYRRRVAELKQELDAADRRGDAAAGIEAQAELDHLTAELRRSTDHRGRPRATGDDAERARKAVTNRIRDAVRAAADAHPVLGRHLEHSVRTGTFCQYAPEHPVVWSVRV